VSPRSIVLYGRSIGSGPTCYLAQKLSKEEKPVGAIILQVRTIVVPLVMEAESPKRMVAESGRSRERLLGLGLGIGLPGTEALQGGEARRRHHPTGPSPLIGAVMPSEVALGVWGVS
jgi:hypothetical protein